MRIFGWIILAVSVVSFLSISGDIAPFLDYPSLIWIAVILTGGLLTSFPPRLINAAIGNALSSKNDCDPEQTAQHVVVLGRAYQLGWGAGLVGFLIGLVAMVQNQDDPDAIGVAIAVSLLVVIYGALLSELVFASLQCSLLSKMVSPDSHSDSTRNQSAIWKAAAVVFLVLNLFFISMNSQSDVSEETLDFLLESSESDFAD